MIGKWVLGCVCVALVTATGVGAADPVVTAVLADWKTRQTKVKTARYEVSGQYERVDLAPGKPQPISLVVLIDLEKMRTRIEKESTYMAAGPVESKDGAKQDAAHQDGVRFAKQHSIQTFDG